uniref:Uncharacterized protein n=1 Tax=Anguilla anguilla TaxID=7936 RepID=A0A0E9T2Q3_ANGAN
MQHADSGGVMQKKS